MVIGCNRQRGWDVGVEVAFSPRRRGDTQRKPASDLPRGTQRNAAGDKKIGSANPSTSRFGIKKHFFYGKFIGREFCHNLSHVCSSAKVGKPQDHDWSREKSWRNESNEESSLTQVGGVVSR